MKRIRRLPESKRAWVKADAANPTTWRVVSSFFLFTSYFPRISLELGIAGLLLAQENKEGDARESSRLEQDCTCRIKIHAEGNNPRERDVSIPLARNGPRCGFTLTFLGEIMRFENHAKE